MFLFASLLPILINSQCLSIVNDQTIIPVTGENDWHYSNGASFGGSGTDTSSIVSGGPGVHGIATSASCINSPDNTKVIDSIDISYRYITGFTFSSGSWIALRLVPINNPLDSSYVLYHSDPLSDPNYYWHVCGGNLACYSGDIENSLTNLDIDVSKSQYVIKIEFHPHAQGNIHMSVDYLSIIINWKDNTDNLYDVCLSSDTATTIISTTKLGNWKFFDGTNSYTEGGTYSIQADHIHGSSIAKTSQCIKSSNDKMISSIQFDYQYLWSWTGAASNIFMLELHPKSIPDGNQKLDIDSCNFYEAGPITAATNNHVGDIKIRQVIEIEFDYQILSNPISEWLNLIHIGNLNHETRFPFIATVGDGLGGSTWHMAFSNNLQGGNPHFDAGINDVKVSADGIEHHMYIKQTSKEIIVEVDSQRIYYDVGNFWNSNYHHEYPIWVSDPWHQPIDAVIRNLCVKSYRGIPSYDLNLYRSPNINNPAYSANNCGNMNCYSPLITNHLANIDYALDNDEYELLNCLLNGNLNEYDGELDFHFPNNGVIVVIYSN
eukprot:111272_1